MTHSLRSNPNFHMRTNKTFKAKTLEIVQTLLERRPRMRTNKTVSYKAVFI